MNWRYILRGAAILAAAAAIVNPYVRNPAQQIKDVLILRDVSDSLKPVGILNDPRAVKWYFASTLSYNPTALDKSRTMLSPALKQAARQADKFAAVIIRTDGQFCDNWTDDAVRLGETGVKVFIQPVGMSLQDAGIYDMQVDRSGESISGWVELASSCDAERVVVVNNSQGTDVLKKAVRLKSQQKIKIPFGETIDVSRAIRYTARLEGKDDFPENDCGEIVSASGENVLRVSLAHPPTKNFSEDIFSCCAVVVEDSGGKILNSSQRDALARYVRSGGGLVLIGAGPHDSPDDRHDPLNKVSALMPVPWARQKLDVTVVLDVSGSMAQQDGNTSRQKIAIASEAVLGLEKHLTDSDTLKIIAFSDKPEIIYSSGGPANFDIVAARLRKIVPAGTTVIFPAIELACKQQTVSDKLIIVVSDMMTEKFDVEKVRRLLDETNIRMAVAVTGSEQAGELAKLAAIKNVRFERAETLDGLAGIFSDFLGEFRSGKLPSRIELLQPGEAWGLIRGISEDLRIDSPITAAGFENSEIICEADGSPAAAYRQVGLGRSAMIAGKGIVPAEDGEQLIARMVELVRRAANDARFSVRCENNGRTLDVNVSVFENFNPVNFLKLIGRADLGGQKIREFEITQTGPGKYFGKVELDKACPAAIGIYESNNVRAIYSSAKLAGGEYRQTGVNYENLRRLGELCGGEIINSAAVVENIARQTAEKISLRVFFVLLTLFLVLFDWIYVRKI